MSTRANSFRASLIHPRHFTITFELVPGHGAGGSKVNRLLRFAAEAREDGRISALSITDNAGGHPALAPVAIGAEIQKIGLEPLIHFSLKDKNRNQVESHLFLYQRLGFSHLLILGGDFPGQTYYGQAKPVYDLDTMQTLQLIEDMKNGRYREITGKILQDSAPDFHCGCVVSPFKMTEEEQVWQYVKLMKKIRSGARFVITQLGFDLDCYRELIEFMRWSGSAVPVLAGVFIPSPAVVGFMAKGGVPGVVIPHDLARQMASESKKERLVRAARMIAVLRGLGYDGVHIGGNGLCFDDIRFVLDTAKTLETSWQDQWSLVHHPVGRRWRFSPDNARRLHCGTEKGAHPIHRLAHRLLFDVSTWPARLFRRFCLFCGDHSRARTWLTAAERLIKTLLFRCRMCGDCTLAESAYRCPQSGCPKGLVNGPCGGSRNRRCEVFPERLCFYVRMYERLDQTTTIRELIAAPVLPPKNWSLEGTSSWINYFQGLDHTAQGKKSGSSN